MTRIELENGEATLPTARDSARSGLRADTPIRPHLFVVLECDRVGAAGARYELTGYDEVIIGRGAERGAMTETEGRYRRLVVRVPGRTMSSLHARLRRRGEDWVLEDAGSTNGSFVNGRKVDSVTLADSDCIELGHTLFNLQIAVPTPAGTEPLECLNSPPLARGLWTLQPLLGQTFHQLPGVASSSLSVVLSGRTGTGKEVLARAIHALSGRPGAFVPVNCGAVTPGLAESLLFGHLRGAFSGAVRNQIGFLRSAHEGTLFLDEIAELSQHAQVSLLRALQESEVVPVGAARAVKMDLRVVAATQEPLAVLVESGILREDLRARLEGFAMALPPLAARREDLGLLLADLLATRAPSARQLRPAVGLALWSYHWPLNIRELEQTLARALVLAEDGPIRLEHLPETMLGGREKASAQRGRERLLHLSKADRELRRELLNWLEHHHGNITLVAQSMHKARMQVHRWMRRFAIDPEVFRPPAERATRGRD